MRRSTILEVSKPPAAPASVPQPSQISATPPTSKKNGSNTVSKVKKTSLRPPTSKASEVPLLTFPAQLLAHHYTTFFSPLYDDSLLQDTCSPLKSLVLAQRTYFPLDIKSSASLREKAISHLSQCHFSSAPVLLPAFSSRFSL